MNWLDRDRLTISLPISKSGILGFSRGAADRLRLRVPMMLTRV